MTTPSTLLGIAIVEYFCIHFIILSASISSNECSLRETISLGQFAHILDMHKYSATCSRDANLIHIHQTYKMSYQCIWISEQADKSESTQSANAHCHNLLLALVGVASPLAVANNSNSSNYGGMPSNGVILEHTHNNLSASRPNTYQPQ